MPDNHDELPAGPDTYTAAASTVDMLRDWLHARPVPSAPTQLLYTAGEALAHVEHAARSAGLPALWTPGAVGLLAALARLYTALLARTSRRDADPESSAARAGSGALATSSCTPIERARRQPEASPRAAAAASLGAANGGDREESAMLHNALLRLLVRPSLVSLLLEVLEHLHTNAELAARWGEGRGGARAAADLWALLTSLARFAGERGGGPAAHTLAPGVLPRCMAVIAGALAPAGGLVPRLLLQPVCAGTLTTQLHVLALLTTLFDAPPSMLGKLLPARPMAGTHCVPLDVPPAGAFYVALHVREAARTYYASCGDAAGAAAALCRLHTRALLLLVRSGRPELIEAAQRGRVMELLLSELQLQVDYCLALDAEEGEVGW